MIKDVVKQVFGEERVARIRIKRDFERELSADQRDNRHILFVHQMGKVGSTTLVKSILSNDPDNKWRIYQTHFLSPEGMAFVEGLHTKGYGGWSNIPSGSKNFLIMSRLISEHLYAGDFSQRRRKMISLVRDPVATNLSGFFHNYRWWPNDLVERCRSYAPGWNKELLDYFLENYPHHVPADWFNLEMKEVFNIDVFAHEFDKKSGYYLYESQNLPMLLVRLENLNASTMAMIRDFLDLNSLSIERTNTASDKWYAELYAKFKSALALPPSYLDEIYSSAFAVHFYSPMEIAQFREKWELSESILSYSRES